MAVANIGAIIFDIGGVLAKDVWENMYYQDADASLVKRYGLNEGEAKKIGKLLWESFAYVAETSANKWRDLEIRYWQLFIAFFREQLKGQHVSEESLIADTDAFIAPIEGIAPIVERLQLLGMTLVICSNNNEFWYRRQMAKCDLHRFFHTSRIVLSCRVGTSKSSPRREMFYAALEAAGLPSSRCLFVDDRQPNVEIARKCGIDAICFKNVVNLTSELRSRGLDI